LFYILRKNNFLQVYFTKKGNFIHYFKIYSLKTRRMELTKAIVTAMKEEANHIIKRLNLKETKKTKHITIYE